jgi:hypothetical protein
MPGGWDGVPLTGQSYADAKWGEDAAVVPGADTGTKPGGDA